MENKRNCRNCAHLVDGEKIASRFFIQNCEISNEPVHVRNCNGDIKCIDWKYKGEANEK